MFQPTDDDVRTALESIRTASALGHSPLLDVPAVTRRLRDQGLRDERAARAWTLTQWLHELVWNRLTALRGISRPDGDGVAPTAEEDLAAFQADFQERRLERQAWSVLYTRYFSGCDMTVLELAEHVPVSRKTLHRRLTRGYGLVAQAIGEVARSGAESEPAQASSNLPVMRSSFIGREKSLQAVHAALGQSGFASVVGPGGIGKSRLANELARRIQSDYPDGVCWVDLAPVGESKIDETVAVAMRLREEPDRSLRKSLLSSLRRRRMLLVLDNCDHVRVALTTLLSAILSSARDVHVLTTSRQVFRVEGEIVHDLGPLTLDSPVSDDQRDVENSEAVQLFVDRAREMSVDWSPSAAELRLVAEICRDLEGLPLAIELAAARKRSLDLASIQAVVSDGARLLSLRGRHAPARHRSLEAVLQWSYDLLSVPERILLRALSVFHGRFSLEMVRAVCPVPIEGAPSRLDLMASLVDASLVAWAESRESSGYRLHAAVRHFARQQLEEHGEDEDLLDRHLAYYAAYAGRAATALRDADQAAWLAEIGARHVDVWAAVDWSVARSDARSGMAVIAGLERYWDIRGHSRAACDLLQRLVELPAVHGAKRELAEASLCLGALLKDRDASAAREHVAKALEVFEELEDADGALRAHVRLAGLCFETRDYDAVKHHGVIALADANELGEPALRLEALLVLARLSIAKMASADELQDQAETIHAVSLDCDDLWLRARSLHLRGMNARDFGHFDVASLHFREAMNTYRHLGDDLGEAISTYNLGVLADLQGESQTALILLEQTLAVGRRMGSLRIISASLNSLGVANVHLNRLDAARRYFVEVLEAGRERRDDHMVGNVLMNLGDLDCKQRRFGEAETALKESLRMRRRLGEWHAANTILTLATVAEGLGQHLRAAQLVGISEAIHAERGVPPVPEEREERDHTSRLLVDALGAEAFGVAMAAGKALDAEQRYAFAIGD